QTVRLWTIAVVLTSFSDRAIRGIGRPREPRIVDAPALVGRAGPRDGSPAPVAPAGIDAAIGWDDRVVQPELLALVEERRSPQRQEQHRRGARPRLRPAVATAMTAVVVVAQHPGRPRVDRL